MIVLSGGEPTIRPELLHWADLVASLGMDLGLVTNGLLLAYPERVDALLRRRLRYVYLSLHGGSARVHNLMVRTHAYEASLAALRNLSGRGLDLHVNCVITRHNLAHLRGVVEAVLPFPDLTLKFSMMEPKGGGDRLFDHLMPRVSEVAERVMDAIAFGESRAGASGPRFEHGGLPLCLLPGRERQFGDLRTHRYRTMIEVGEPDYFPVDDLNKRHPPPATSAACAAPAPACSTATTRSTATPSSARAPARAPTPSTTPSQPSSPYHLSPRTCPRRPARCATARSASPRGTAAATSLSATPASSRSTAPTPATSATPRSLTSSTPAARSTSTPPASPPPDNFARDLVPPAPRLPVRRLPARGPLHRPLRTCPRGHLHPRRRPRPRPPRDPHWRAARPRLRRGPLPRRPPPRARRRQPALPRPRPRPRRPRQPRPAPARAARRAPPRLRRRDPGPPLRSPDDPPQLEPPPRSRRRPRPSAPAPAPRRHPHRRRQPRLRPRPHPRPDPPRRAVLRPLGAPPQRRRRHRTRPHPRRRRRLRRPADARTASRRRPRHQQPVAPDLHPQPAVTPAHL
jgi:hypothetical protein